MPLTVAWPVISSGVRGCLDICVCDCVFETLRPFHRHGAFEGADRDLASGRADGDVPCGAFFPVRPFRLCVTGGERVVTGFSCDRFEVHFSCEAAEFAFFVFDASDCRFVLCRQSFQGPVEFFARHVAEIRFKELCRSCRVLFDCECGGCFRPPVAGPGSERPSRALPRPPPPTSRTPPRRRCRVPLDCGSSSNPFSCCRLHRAIKPGTSRFRGRGNL